MNIAARTESDHRRARRLGLAALALGLVAMAGMASPARAAAADRIEDKLKAEGVKVVEYLRDHGYQAVGVLKFRVKLGNEPESFSVGILNVVMTRRLQNLLIAMNDEAKPLQIIHEAAQVAAGKKEHANYTSPEGCAKFFEYKYPLAWGSGTVQADVFLTGLVKVSPDKSTTTVVIEAIDRETKKPKEITSFQVRTDRTILSDACESFVLPGKQVRKLGADEQEEEAAKNSYERDQDKDRPKPGDRLVKLEILYSGKAQEEAGSEKHPGEYQVPEPQENDEVVLALTNLSDKRVAVVLAVNGKNTLYKQDRLEARPEGLAKWILEPGVRYTVRGYYHEGGLKYEPFKVISEEESLAEEEQNLHPKLGAIELFVFTEGGKKSPVLVREAGLRKPVGAQKKKPQTAKEAAALVQQTSRRSTKAAGLIKPGENTKDTEVKTASFNDPQLQEYRAYWYYDRKKK
jgi:hypothetical protein